MASFYQIYSANFSYFLANFGQIIQFWILKKTQISQLALKRSTPAMCLNTGSTDLKNDAQPPFATTTFSVKSSKNNFLFIYFFFRSTWFVEQKWSNRIFVPSTSAASFDNRKLVDSRNSNVNHARNLPVLGTEHLPGRITTNRRDDLLDQKRWSQHSKHAPRQRHARERRLLLLLRSYG